MRRRQNKAGTASGPGKAWDAKRPEEVARARRLIQDKNYPSKQILDSVAELLSKRLKPSK